MDTLPGNTLWLPGSLHDLCVPVWSQPLIKGRMLNKKLSRADLLSETAFDCRPIASRSEGYQPSVVGYQQSAVSSPAVSRER